MHTAAKINNAANVSAESGMKGYDSTLNANIPRSVSSSGLQDAKATLIRCIKAVFGKSAPPDFVVRLIQSFNDTLSFTPVFKGHQHGGIWITDEHVNVEISYSNGMLAYTTNKPLGANVELFDIYSLSPLTIYGNEVKSDEVDWIDKCAVRTRKAIKEGTYFLDYVYRENCFDGTNSSLYYGMRTVSKSMTNDPWKDWDKFVEAIYQQGQKAGYDDDMRQLFAKTMITAFNAIAILDVEVVGSPMTSNIKALIQVMV